MAVAAAGVGRAAREEGGASVKSSSESYEPDALYSSSQKSDACWERMLIASEVGWPESAMVNVGIGTEGRLRPGGEEGGRGGETRLCR